MSRPFWTDPDDEQAAARFSAEHSIVSHMTDDGTLEMAMGNEALLPEWPPVIRLPNLLSIPMPAGAPIIASTTCAGCHTALTERSGTWRHEAGLRERDGCTNPVPR